MRIWLTLILLLIIPFGWETCQSAQAQGVAADVSFSRHRHFRIPFKAGPGWNQLKQLQLFVSTDQGKTWHPSAIVPPDLPPDQQSFPFICENDGLYWFTVQTTDKGGQKYPLSMDTAKPSLKVMVDTLPPEVKLFSLPAKQGAVGVTWEIREEHIDLLDPKSVRLEYRPLKGEIWIPLEIDRAVNQFYFNPQTNTVVEVRIQVQDRAGNLESATTKVSLKGNIGDSQPPPDFSKKNGDTTLPNQKQAHYPVVPASRRLVNSRKISLNYKLEEVGPSGVSTVELWFTQDGRTWNKYPLPKSEDQKIANPLTFEVQGEGIYGFTLIARSGVGLGAQPPQIGDEPQIWVEVDLTKPIIKMQKVLVGKGADKGKLFIHWGGADKNMAKLPITISYAELVTGPWLPIATDLPNSGNYTWTMPDPVPYQFYVRIEARDLAGNTGEDTTPDLIKVDLAQPKVNILGVGPASGVGGN